LLPFTGGNKNFVNQKMEDFLADYAKNIGKILSKPSGNHMFNEERAETWISKLSPGIVKFGRLFYENIQYIQWSDLLQNLQVLLHRLANCKREKSAGTNIWFTAPGKSNHVFALLAYHYCKNNDELNVLLPDEIITNRPRIYTYSDYYFFDDISYTGSQMVKLKEAISSDIGVFHYAWCYITETAISRFTASTNIHLYYAIILDSLTKKVGIGQAAIIKILFNPESYYGDVIVYCDHKLADSPSTYNLTLQYGIIPPRAINFKLIKAILRSANNNFNDSTRRELDLLATTSLATESYEYQEWDYYPFIDGCQTELPEQILRNNWIYLMMYNTLVQFTYGPLLTDALCRSTQQLVRIKTTTFKHSDRSEYDKIHDKSSRCPASWYL
jgi:hypothetical protein